ncbi:hypothetical protein A45J_0361 [hot springs metagenome]|uniref:Uncharacterized protein n=1 Tax=hot springs metagenome TaxID=433727 RepID=A0A5J4KYT3_9ZZZZ
MLERKIVVPDHYKVLAQELKPLIREIQNAFVNRPVPEGLPIQDIALCSAMWINPLEGIFKNITSDLNKLGQLMMPGKEAVSSLDIKIYIKSIRQSIDKVIDIFHNIWKRPFPVEYADGQPLFSAVPEMIIRKCLTLFEQIVDIVENHHDVMKKYGSSTVSLNVTFGDEEINRLDRWMNTKAAANYEMVRKDMRNSIWTLAAVFLLGYLIGDD